MGQIADLGTPLTFNGALEAGVRAVAVLGSAFPRAFDLQRLTAFDYLLVRTAQLGGPGNLHPGTPIQTPATEVRRKIVQRALELMMTRDLVARRAEQGGICYFAGETAAMFLDSLRSPYLSALKERAEWLATYVGLLTDNDIDLLMRQFFDNWLMEFQDVEKSTGSSS